MTLAPSRSQREAGSASVFGAVARGMGPTVSGIDSAPVRFLGTGTALLIIFGVWIAVIAVLSALSVAGAPYGMQVWPLGEDRSWGDWMQHVDRMRALPREAWLHQNRNPLSSWWYVAASPLIKAADWGLYAVRKAIDLLLATATFLVLDSVLRGRARRLSLCVAILVMFWTFSGYREQVIWNFIGAMALSLLSVSAFFRYLDSGRRNAALALAAAALFLIASATYTLQIGIGVTLVCASFFRASAEEGNAGLRNRAASGVPWIEAASIAAIAGAFIAIWYTTSRPAVDYFSFERGGALNRFIESVGYLVWHGDYNRLLSQTIGRMGMVRFVAAAAVLAFVVAVLLARIVEAADIEAFSGNAAWILIVIGGVSLMLFVAETANPTWPPGSRSRMVQQFVSPVLFGLMLGALARWTMRWRSSHTGVLVFRVGFSVVFAVAVLVGLEHNRQMVELTSTQKQMARQFRAIDAEQRAPHYIALTDYDPVTIWGYDGLSEPTAHVLLGRNDVTLRFVQRQPTPSPEVAPYWKITFYEDDIGVGGARLGRIAPIPYDDVVVLRERGGTLEVPQVLEPAEFAGTEVEWRRSAPLHQHLQPAPACPWRFGFDGSRPLDSGWSVVEPWPSGGSAVWMASRKATLRTGSSCTGKIRVRATIVGSMSPRILASLRVSAGAAAVTMSPVETIPGKGVFVQATLDASSTAALTFEVDDTVRPAGGTRDLALMFRAIEIGPAP